MRHPRKNLIKSVGSIQDIAKRPDTYELRHNEHGIFTWLWIADECKAVVIMPVLNPILSHSRSALAVFQALVNRVVYRKPTSKMRLHNNGISRNALTGRHFRSYCPHCVDVVLSNKKPWVVRLTKGVYLPIEHECNSVRVYDIHGTLLEVKANG